MKAVRLTDVKVAFFSLTCKNNIINKYFFSLCQALRSFSFSWDVKLKCRKRIHRGTTAFCLASIQTVNIWSTEWWHSNTCFIRTVIINWWAVVQRLFSTNQFLFCCRSLVAVYPISMHLCTFSLCGLISEVKWFVCFHCWLFFSKSYDFTDQITKVN